MGTCDNCIYAEWERTKAGRLHPNGHGLCTYLMAHPLDVRLPAAFSWFNMSPPDPNGGWIKRKTFDKPCVFKDGSRA